MNQIIYLQKHPTSPGRSTAYPLFHHDLVVVVGGGAYFFVNQCGRGLVGWCRSRCKDLWEGVSARGVKFWDGPGGSHFVHTFDSGVCIPPHKNLDLIFILPSPFNFLQIYVKSPIHHKYLS